ncbi:MAG: hypothetical protein MUP02_11385 [Actinobacteria bacterium]|nr:hypothetical protein [Actinomycetota bacterium]
MSIESQIIIEILQYISFTGLVLSGLIALFLPGLRRKMVLIFIMFIFTTIISFVFYSGILLFVTGFAAIFVFIILYMIIAQLRMSRKDPGGDYSVADGWSGRKDAFEKKIKASAVPGIILPILFSGYLGYQIYISTRPYFVEADGGSDISIVSLDRISELLFSEYLPVVLILIAALLAATIWFTVILDFRKDRQKEIRR